MSRPLDAIDRKLISELTRDCRAPYTEIARRVGVNPVTTKSRFRALLESGVVRLELLPDPAKLGYQTGAFIGLHTRMARAAQVAEALKSHPAVVYAATTSGRYDVVLFALFRSCTDLARFVEHDLGETEGVRGMEVEVNLKVVKAPRHWPGLAIASKGIDATDRRIMGTLCRDLRMPLSAVAHKVGLSVPTVRNRLGRLVREGVIAFSALVDNAGSGRTAAAMTGLRVRQGRMKDVQRALLTSKPVRYAVVTAGRYNLMFWGQFESLADMAGFLRRELGSLDGVERSETLLCLQVMKWSFADIIAAA